MRIFLKELKTGDVIIGYEQFSYKNSDFANILFHSIISYHLGIFSSIILFLLDEIKNDDPEVRKFKALKIESKECYFISLHTTKSVKFEIQKFEKINE